MRAWLAILLLAPQDPGDVRGRVSLAPDASPRKKIKVNYKAPGMAARKPPSASPFVVWLEGPPGSRIEGKTAEILQEGLEFRPRVLAVRAGTTVRFPNGDDVQHNVLSFSEARPFDLGRYPKGESKEVVFDKPGLVEICCEIHSHMRAFVLVVDHPHFTLAAEDGSYVLPKVPPGAYTLVAWKEGFEAVRRPLEVGAGGAALDVRIARADVPGLERSAAPAVCCAR